MHVGWLIAAYLLGMLVGGGTVAWLALRWMTQTWETLERLDAALWRAAGKD